MARAITQIGRRGTGHLANRALWHEPSRKSGGMAEKGPPISGIRRHGTNHHANRAKWCHGAGFARFRPPFVPRRRICVMEGRDSAMPSDLRDGEGPVSAMPSDLRDGEGPVSAIPSDLRDGEGAFLPCRRICEMAPYRPDPTGSKNLVGCTDGQAMRHAVQHAYAARGARRCLHGPTYAVHVKSDVLAGGGRRNGQKIE